MTEQQTTDGTLEGHSGELAVAVARAYGVETMFTLCLLYTSDAADE